MLYLAILLTHGLDAANFDPYCDSDVYGKPDLAECVSVISRFPLQDTAVRYFVEQQMRTAPPVAAWSLFRDLRSPEDRQMIVQLPKWVSYGQLSFLYLSLSRCLS